MNTEVCDDILLLARGGAHASIASISQLWGTKFLSRRNIHRKGRPTLVYRFAIVGVLL